MNPTHPHTKLSPLPLPKRRKNAPQVIRTTGGKYDRVPGIFFPALSGGMVASHLTTVRSLGVAVNRCLIAYNEMPGSNGKRWWENTAGPDSIPELSAMVEDGVHWFLDSGAFTFCHDYGRTHGMPGQLVFSMPLSTFEPGLLTSYENHLGKYVKRMEGLLWGAVEIDIGNATERTDRRNRMSADHGVNLIPVFRPECDPLEYLEEIMSANDRICIPTTVRMLPAAVRWALIRRAVELQKAKYPYCYIHVLGSAPTHSWAALASASGSCDSSSWIAPVRYGRRPTYSLAQSVSLQATTFAAANPGKHSILFRELDNPHGLPSADTLNELYLASMGTFLALNLPPPQL